MLGTYLTFILSGVAAALALWCLLPSSPRLADRVRPYTWGSRVAMGLAPDVEHLHESPAQIGWLGRIFGLIGGWFTRRNQEELLVKLRQAAWLPALSDEEQLARYGLRTARLVASGGAVGGVLGFIWGGGSLSRAVLLAAGGALVGYFRHRGELDRAIEERRRKMQIEIYTIDQILALQIRSGGSPVQAVQQVVERGRGEVVRELAEALRMHRAGITAADTFRRLAETTPEPFCARSYLLLAAGEERGADLAAGLISLAEDGREARREALRRGAVKRRAAMLVPTIGILAPVLLLFIGAPLPYLVLNS